VYHGAVTNSDVARLFDEIATLLELRGESAFRVRAYQRAAQSITSLGEDLRRLAERGDLQTVPGVGKDLAARITEYLQTGAIAQLEALRREVPPDFLSLLEVRGLGPKTAKLLLERLGVDSVDRLETVCVSGAILEVAGIRAKTRDNLLKGIAIWRAGRARTLLAPARTIAREVVAALTAQAPVQQIEIAGSLRRMRETVKDVDLLVTSAEPARVIEAFVSFPWVVDVIGAGDTKASVRHRDGIQIDLRAVDPNAFGAALQYFTGSREHNVRLREMAARRRLKISEYGVFDETTGTRIAGATEADVYAAVGLPWIPPELRENGGEIEAALAGALPALLTAHQVRGDLHAHTEWSDGHHSIEALVAAAEARGYEYIIVSDHSRSATVAGGLSVERLREQIRTLRALQPRFQTRILAGSECDILADGTLDFPVEVLRELDIVLAAVHSRFTQSRAEMTARIVRALENPSMQILVHPTGRLIGSREPYDVDLETVFAAAKAHGKALEINCSPDRLDLKDSHARRAADLGIPVAINSDTHYLANLDNLELGVATARRAWIGPTQVLNARPLGELLAWAGAGREP
jgi:DNA polymerase (family X)